MYFTEPFLSCIKENNNDLVKLVLEDCGLYLAADANGTTLLHYATEHDNIDITKYLLGKGSKIDAQDSKGRTPLMLAVRKSHAAIMQTLLTAGADIEIKDVEADDVLDIAFDQFPEENILVPLFSALKKKYSRGEVAKMLVDYYCGIDIAVYVKDAGIIEYMIQCGRPVQCNSKDDRYPLHQAVICGDVETVKVLLKWGADIDARVQNGVTPLFFLYLLDYEHNNEKLDILKIFLDAGASSLTTCTEEGIFQIISILIEGNDEAVRLVLESHIDFTSKDDDGRTILHYLAKNRNPGVVEVLKQHIYKFDVNAANKNKYTPLHFAVKKANVDMVKFLLSQGADATTALFCAYTTFKTKLEALHDECTEHLLQYNADIETLFSDESGRQYTIFDIAQEEDYFGRMKLALAELAIQEQQGILITEDTYLKINSHPPFKTYFQECQGYLRTHISGSVSVYSVVTAKANRMVKYLNNEELVQRLKNMVENEKLKSVSKYYNNILKKRFRQGILKKKLRNKAVRIVRNLSGNRFGMRAIVTEKIVDYLNVRDLRQLCVFSN